MNQFFNLKNSNQDSKDFDSIKQLGNSIDQDIAALQKRIRQKQSKKIDNKQDKFDQLRQLDKSDRSITYDEKSSAQFIDQSQISLNSSLRYKNKEQKFQRGLFNCRDRKVKKGILPSNQLIRNLKFGLERYTSFELSNQKLTGQLYNIPSLLKSSLKINIRRPAFIFYIGVFIMTLHSFVDKSFIEGGALLLIPLLFTLLKEALEDVQRIQSSNNLNSQYIKSYDFKNKKFQTKTISEIQEGDLIKIRNGGTFPADILLICNSDINLAIKIDSSQIQGTTLLEDKEALTSMDRLEKLENLKGQVEYETPNSDLSQWNGRCTINEFYAYGCTLKNLVLRGSILRGTKYTIGVVMNTCYDLKLLKSQKLELTVKKSLLSSKLNLVLAIWIILQFLIQFIFSAQWISWYYPNLFVTYAGGMKPKAPFNLFLNKWTLYWLNFIFAVPITLYIFQDVLKLLSAYFIRKDVQLYDKESRMFTQIKSSDSLEDLGQVQMIFTDKTGTITQNKLTLKELQINGKTYSNPTFERKLFPQKPVASYQKIEELKKKLDKELLQPQPNAFPLQQFFKCIALCNTLQVKEYKPNQFEIIGDSQDEIAVENGCSIYGISLLRKEEDKIFLKNEVSGITEQYDKVFEIPFTSERKRQTVIVKNQNGSYYLYSKGADIEMIPRIDFNKNGIDNLELIVKSDLIKFGRNGLRTLIYAKKSITQEDFENIMAQFQNITQSKNSYKDLQLLQLYNEIERDLRFLGITGVEDELSKGVPFTINTLEKANIKFVMLTGDSLENSKTCAYQAQLFKQKYKLSIINSDKVSEIRDQLLDLIPKKLYNSDALNKDYKFYRQRKQLLAVDWQSIKLILRDKYLQDLFFIASMSSKSVICTRLKPIWKGRIVKIFKERSSWVNLAIGDGDNDIAMLREANIGVGIRSREESIVGLFGEIQTSKFSYLLRLLLIHGRLSYYRITQFYCFQCYKQFALLYAELFFLGFQNFTGQLYFSPILPILYYSIFSNLQGIVTYLFDRDLNDDYTIKFPQVYRLGQQQELFGIRIFFKYVIFAIWHGFISFIIFFEPYSRNLSTYTGQTSDHYVFSTLSFLVIQITIFAKLLNEPYRINKYQIIAGFGSIFLFIFVFLFLQIPNFELNLCPELRGVFQQIIKIARVPFYLIATPICCILPDYCLKTFLGAFFPTNLECILMKQDVKPKINFYDKFIKRRIGNFLKNKIQQNQQSLINTSIKPYASKEKRSHSVVLKFSDPDVLKYKDQRDNQEFQYSTSTKQPNYQSQNHNKYVQDPNAYYSNKKQFFYPSAQKPFSQQDQLSQQFYMSNQKDQFAQTAQNFNQNHVMSSPFKNELHPLSQNDYSMDDIESQRSFVPLNQPTQRNQFTERENQTQMQILSSRPQTREVSTQKDKIQMIKRSSSQEISPSKWTNKEGERDLEKNNKVSPQRDIQIQTDPTKVNTQMNQQQQIISLNISKQQNQLKQFKTQQAVQTNPILEEQNLRYNEQSDLKKSPRFKKSSSQIIGVNPTLIDQDIPTSYVLKIEQQVDNQISSLQVKQTSPHLSKVPSQQETQTEKQLPRNIIETKNQFLDIDEPGVPGSKPKGVDFDIDDSDDAWTKKKKSQPSKFQKNGMIFMQYDVPIDFAEEINDPIEQKSNRLSVGGDFQRKKTSKFKVNKQNTGPSVFPYEERKSDLWENLEISDMGINDQDSQVNFLMKHSTDTQRAKRQNKQL